MEILHDPTPSSDLPRDGVVTIGNFDGVHLGHQALLAGAIARARELGVPAVALTFNPHPEKVLRPGTGLKLLCTPVQRAQLLARCGLDTLVEIGFDRRFAATPAEEFAREFLFRRLAPVEVRLGANFRFGAERAGDLAFLSVMGSCLGFAVIGVDPVVEGGSVISSTRVRREVAHGHVEEAGRLLGRPLYVDGNVYSGERMGRKLGFPTLNIGLDNELMPAHGVYVTAVHIPSFGRVFPSVTNIGVRPTVYENYRVTVESHLLDFTADVYREPVRLYFFRRLREEKIFTSSIELVAQIRRDVETARLFFLQHGPLAKDLVLR
ncbi:MAG: riboflavin biosynthesis protein RibF [Acidobacteriota bacterium]